MQGTKCSRYNCQNDAYGHPGASPAMASLCNWCYDEEIEAARAAQPAEAR